MKEYQITIAGLQHTVLLSDDEAKQRGLLTEDKAAETKDATPPANKARATQLKNKS